MFVCQVGLAGVVDYVYTRVFYAENVVFLLFFFPPSLVLCVNAVAVADMAEVWRQIVLSR